MTGLFRTGGGSPCGGAIRRGYLLLPALLGASCLADRDHPPEAVPASTPRQLTDWPGTETNPRISPDGGTIAFESVVDGTSGIYLLDLRTDSVTRFQPGPGNDRRPAWSPGGDRLAFISDRGGSTALWVAPLHGGDARRLLEGAFLSAPDWSPDGTRIGLSRVVPGLPGSVNGRTTILAVDVEDGTVSELTTEGDEWWPRWSADGVWLYYYVGASDVIEAVHARTGEVRRIGGGEAIGWRPAAAPDGSRFAFVSDLEGWGLWTGSVLGAAPPTLVLDRAGSDAPSYSPDGRNLVYSADTTSVHVVRLRLADGRRDTVAVGGTAPQALASGDVAFLPEGSPRNRLGRIRGGRADTLELPFDNVVDFAFSPDGRYVAVAALGHMNARYDLHLLRSDGGYVRRLTRFGDVEHPVWCDDNRTMVFSTRTEKASNAFRGIWSVDAETGDLAPITTAQDAHKQPTHCDRDARRITYEDRLNASGAYTLNWHATSAERESLGDVTGARWSPDGTRLLYAASRDGRRDLFVLDPDGTETRLTDDTAVESDPAWSTDGSAVVFGARSPNRGIWLLPLAGS